LKNTITALLSRIVFKNSIGLEEKKILNKPISAIIDGISFFICFHMIVLFNFLTTSKFEGLEHIHKPLAVSTVPLLMIAIFLILTFYYRFYFFLDSYNKIKKGIVPHRTDLISVHICGKIVASVRYIHLEKI